MARPHTPSLTTLVRRYLEHRRSLGYLMPRHDLPLMRFARFHQAQAPGQPLKTAVILKWATLPGTGNHTYYIRRLTMVRGFAKYCAILDPRGQIPDYRLLGQFYRRVAPHIYTARQIALIVRRARDLPVSRFALRPLVIETFLGLIACTGLRTCEALRLRLGDFDAHMQTLTIRRTKSSPERILPLHPSVTRALLSYLDVRAPFAPHEDAFFINGRSRPLRPASVYVIFQKLAKDIRPNGARAHPRIYDLRHTFATRHIAQWNQSGASVAQRLLQLSRYMGHQNFGDTWWYVSADPKTLRRAASRLEHFFKGGSGAR